MNPQFIDFLKRRWVLPTAVGIVASSGGGVLGYILGKRQERKETVEQINAAFEVAKKGELRPIKIDIKENETTFESVEDVPVITEGKFESLNLIPADQLVFDVPPVRVVREIHDEIEWDWEAEKNTRTKEEPYVIHRDEFFADEMGYTQSTVTYYAGDDVMTDELDTPIYGHTAMVGELNFGHGSGDPSVVYIRSELLEHEYEVVRHPGFFLVEVMGETIEAEYKDQDLKHSAVRKFRME